MRAWTLLLVVPAVAAAAAPAAAAPRLDLWSPVEEAEFGRGGRCFPAGVPLALRGTGFAPGGVVRVAGRRVRAGRRGRFTLDILARTPRRNGQERVTVRARQPGSGLTASARYWASIEGVDVPSWTRQRGERRAVPGTVERARLSGLDWAIGRPAYVHYLLGGRQVFAQRLARLRGPCGSAEFRFTQFPFAPADGLYVVDFSTRKVYTPNLGGGYRRVRVGPRPAPLPIASTPLFTIAGDGTDRPAPDGAPATASGLSPFAALTARPEGGLLVTERFRVRAVTLDGRVTTVAGTGRDGPAGDGGPATAASVFPTAIAAWPGGGFVVTDCLDPVPPAIVGGARVRRVMADGTITAIAGTGRVGRRPRDGTPALAANLGCDGDLAVAPDGRVLLGDGNRVMEIGTDGRVRTLAGNGRYPQFAEFGGPAKRTPLSPAGIEVLPDGEVLIADDAACHVYELAGDRLTLVAGDGSAGRRRDDGAPAVEASVCPRDIAAAPGGGFYVTDVGSASGVGSEPRVRFVRPDGRIQTVAGSGRFSPEPSRGEELRGDGMSGPQADLQAVGDVAVLADGGVAFIEGNDDGRHPPGLIRYLPADGPLLAVGLRRDRDRIFSAGAPAFTTVSLTAPAEVTVTVRRDAALVSTQTVALPAGDSRVALPALPGVPHAVALSARDGAGRVAEDHAAILPRGWLATKLARSVIEALIFTATDAGSSSGDALRRCRRFAPGRIDCAVVPERRCTAVTLRLGADGRLRWGTYRCPIARAPALVKPLRRLREDHLSCEDSETSCPPPLFGRVADRWLVPWD